MNNVEPLETRMKKQENKSSLINIFSMDPSSVVDPEFKMPGHIDERALIESHNRGLSIVLKIAEQEKKQHHLDHLSSLIETAAHN